MTARNDITGDSIATKGTTDAYRDNYDRIFGKKLEEVAERVATAFVKVAGDLPQEQFIKALCPRTGIGRSQLSEDIGPIESRAEQYAKDELALEEMRTRL
jgi:hypothetical protein